MKARHFLLVFFFLLISGVMNGQQKKDSAGISKDKLQSILKTAIDAKKEARPDSNMWVKVPEHAEKYSSLNAVPKDSVEYSVLNAGKSRKSALKSQLEGTKKLPKPAPEKETE